MNRALYIPGTQNVSEVICGKFLVVAVDGNDNITTLTDKQIVKYMNRFGEPELFRVQRSGEITAIKLSDIKKRKKAKKHSHNVANSIACIRKSHEYTKRVNKVGKLLGKLTGRLPQDLLDLLADYIEEELAFQKFAEEECFKAGIKFAKRNKK